MSKIHVKYNRKASIYIPYNNGHRQSKIAYGPKTYWRARSTLRSGRLCIFCGPNRPDYQENDFLKSWQYRYLKRRRNR